MGVYGIWPVLCQSVVMTAETFLQMIFEFLVKLPFQNNGKEIINVP